MQTELAVEKGKGKGSIADKQELDKDFEKILRRIKQNTDVDVKLYRTATLERRMGLRLAATKSKSYREYLSVLRKNPAENEVFLQTLTIPVSDFFRDKDIYKNLKTKVLPAVIHRAKKCGRKKIRIWSVGCSKGQEPYSLAMLLLDVPDVQEQKADLGFVIHATDLNRTFLKKANAGVYTPVEVKNVPRKYLREYFFNKDRAYHIKPSVKKLVRFRRQDLIREKPGGAFDLILCRNVLIFFKPHLRKKIMENFHSSLYKEGILVLGTAESPSDERLFRCLSSPDHFFQKAM